VKRALVVVAVLALATAGAALATKPGSGMSSGTGRVFVPNPVQDLGIESLTDQQDADYAALAPAYHVVALTHLDGSGYLDGDYATIVAGTGSVAYSPTNTFLYDRHQDEFEQVMGYYWITEAQQYIQSLGFGTGKPLPPINQEPQRLRIDQWGADNSFATEHKDEMRLGKGGVDDAEDAEVILHEYGHAIHFAQGFQFSTEEAGAISEGFGDYWAVTVSEHVRQLLGLPASPDPACVADWDATSYTSSVPHCLRRLDEDLTYPGDLVGEVHADGEIWSRALWDIRGAIGPTKADTSILDGQFGFDGGTMPALAQDIVAAARSLYGARTASRVEAAFEARGIL
jgi:zinc metalloprotease ZmpB